VIPAEVLAACRAAWPGIDVADDVFAAYVRERVPAETLAKACVADLWLACAVHGGNAAGLRAFEQRYLTQIGAAVAHLGGGTALADDVLARMRERLLDPGGGKLAEYRGRGDLHGWIRVVAVREALQLLRQRRRETPLSSSEELADKLDSSPPQAMTDEERRVYRESFGKALAALTPRERNLLRQHYLYGSTVDELGTLYGVHRATAARWIAQVREVLLHRTRSGIGEALRVTGTELDSVMAKVAGELDLSLRHTLSNE
jgi:RNA polymerase sigma-70 factor (ECF subfamily)